MEQEDDDAESVSSSIEDVSEPGVGLGNTTTIESEDSQDELISLHESQTLKVRMSHFNKIFNTIKIYVPSLGQNN